MSDKASPPHLFANVLGRVHAACGALAAEGGWPADIDLSRVVVEPPRDASHGDMATNAAMVLAKDAKIKPRDLADKIAEKLRADDLVASVEVAGPGFINLTLKPEVWAGELRTMLREGASYGKSAIGHGAKVDVLARSAFLRYREALGENIGEIPEGLYPGDYCAGRAGARRRAWRQA